MNTTNNETLIRGLYDAVNRKDLDTIAALGAPNSEWLDVPFNFTSRGERAIIDPWKSWFDIFPDATCEVRSLVSLGDHVIAQGIGRGTQRGVFNSPAGTLPPSGRTMEVRFCSSLPTRAGEDREGRFLLRLLLAASTVESGARRLDADTVWSGDGALACLASRHG
jgi:ketosteroid isomerase-like protein